MKAGFGFEAQTGLCPHLQAAAPSGSEAPRGSSSSRGSLSPCKSHAQLATAGERDGSELPAPCTHWRSLPGMAPPWARGQDPP